MMAFTPIGPQCVLYFRRDLAGSPPPARGWAGSSMAVMGPAARPAEIGCSSVLSESSP
jgi:hypothetical protein